MKLGNVRNMMNPLAAMAALAQGQQQPQTSESQTLPGKRGQLMRAIEIRLSLVPEGSTNHGILSMFIAIPSLIPEESDGEVDILVGELEYIVKFYRESQGP